jgi:hypothetical protein
MKTKEVLLALVALLTVIQLANFASSAPSNYSYIISNSNDWKDVYSTVHYANLVGVGSDFLVGESSGPLLLKDLGKDNVIRVISSNDNKLIINYDGYIRDQQFKGAYESVVNNANLQLITELPDITNFIVVSDQYGYSGIAVVPYAVQTHAWVFFASRSNIAEISSILASRKVDHLMIYGYVDREVTSALSGYSPQVIDTGDRFQDNIQIVQKYMSVNPVKQIALTNGEFIEKEIMSGLEPVLFTGQDSTPDSISAYIKSADIDVGVLVGADLVGAATNIRRTTGISVIVKFARGARNPAGAISAVEGIDTFPIPTPIMNLDIYSLKYNKATSVIEATYNSSSNIPIYLKGSIDLQDDTGKKIKIGDVDPVFLAPNSYKTLTYSDVKLDGTKISGSLYTLFGETKNALEKVLQKSFNVDIINVVDNCQMNITSVRYNTPKSEIFVKVRNPSVYDCWAQAELKDVNIAGIATTLSSTSSVKVMAGKTVDLPISQVMTDADLQANPTVDTTVYYGERSDSLLKSVHDSFNLEVERISFATISLIVVGIIILIAIIFLIIFFLKRRKENEWN